jgi:hypothetical protein
LGQDSQRPVVKFGEIGVLKREFELRPRRAAAEPHSLQKLA